LNPLPEHRVGGPSQLLPGKSAFSLGSRHRAWVVDQGSAAVSIVDFEHGEPKGARRYLFTVKSGDYLLGMSGAHGSKYQELLAVAIAPARKSLGF